MKSGAEQADSGPGDRERAGEAAAGTAEAVQGSVLGWLFTRDGDAFVPTDWTRGPWNPEFLHGGPIGALFAHLVEQHRPGPDFVAARITIDLFRAVPFAPLHGVARIVRDSARLRLLDVDLLAGDAVVARASGLFLKRTSDEPQATTVAAAPNPSPVNATPGHWMIRDPHAAARFHNRVEVRQATEMDAGVPVVVWVRHRFELSPGMVMTPLVRLGAIADFTNGMGMMSRKPRGLFINSDIALHLYREPATDWLCLQTVGRGDAAGVASTNVNLHDERGLIGHAAMVCLANEMGRKK